MIGSKYRARSAVAILVLAGATAAGGAGYAIAGYDVSATVSAVTIAPTLYTSSGDELIPIPEDPGSYWIAERLMIGLESGKNDPTALIVQIADTYGGVIVGAYPDLRIYQLRFTGYGPEALEDLGETIEARFDVDWVLRDIKSNGFSLFF